MRRTLSMMGLGLALTIGGATVAAAQSTTPAPAAPGQARHAGKHAGKRLLRALFRGVNPTAEQKAQIRAQLQADRAKLAPEMKAAREQFRAARGELAAARQRNDSAGVLAARTKIRQLVQQRRAELKPVREQELASVRAILTPEQRATFDQNVARLKARQAERVARRGKHAASRPGSQG